jgi:hypothetical protein
MKFKFLIVGLFFLAGLLFSMPVFAYTRTPTGSVITNPVNFAGTRASAPCGSCNYWKLSYKKYHAERINFGTCYTWAQWNYNETINLPVGKYASIYIQWFAYSDCSGNFYPNYMVDLEGDSWYDRGNVIFELPPPPPPPIITLPTNMATGMLAYAGQLFTDLSPIVLILIGLPFAFLIIVRILVFANILDKDNKKLYGNNKVKTKKDDWL